MGLLLAVSLKKCFLSKSPKWYSKQNMEVKMNALWVFNCSHKESDHPKFK